MTTSPDQAGLLRTDGGSAMALVAPTFPRGAVLTLVPLSLAEARAYVAAHHRHNEPPRGHKFSIGLSDGESLRGVVIASRPVSRNLDDGLTIELIRVTTEGNKNACSRLYGAACRAAAAMGYHRAVTYTLEDEPGTSLLASGFRRDGVTTGGEWTPMDGLVRSAQKLRLFDGPKMPTGPKIRWVRTLSFSPPTAGREAARTTSRAWHERGSLRALGIRT